MSKKNVCRCTGCKKRYQHLSTLEYQSCNDHEGFNPATVPVSWKLALQQNITERITRPQ